MRKPSVGRDGLTTCVVCGCTEVAACQPNSCTWWVSEPALCSACGEFLQNVRSIPRVFAILRACGVLRGATDILVALERMGKPKKKRAT